MNSTPLPARERAFADNIQRFSDFGFPDLVIKALDEMGLETPTPIQKMAIPLLMDGQDLVGLAQTGTGKTAAFLLPLLTRLLEDEPVSRGEQPHALILAPTRELALQVLDGVRKLTSHLRLRSVAIYGGARYDGQINGLKRGADIVVATPGRLEDMIARGAVTLNDIRYFILDEADHMLDLGFYPAIQRISEQIPESRQTMLFSATMPDDIRKLAKAFLRNPVHIKAPDSQNSNRNITQKIYLVEEDQKRQTLADMLAKDDVSSSVIFVRTKRKADGLAENLVRLGFKVDALHGDMRQFIRRKVLNKFKEGKLTALIATDVAARGIDIPALSHVFNFDLPEGHDAYTHRIGRTGRAGKSGVAVSFCARSDHDKLRVILSRQKAKIQLFDSDNTELDPDELRLKSAGRPNRRRPQRGAPSFKDRKPSRRPSRKPAAKQSASLSEQDEVLQQVSLPPSHKKKKTPAKHPGSKHMKPRKARSKAQNNAHKKHHSKQRVSAQSQSKPKKRPASSRSRKSNS